MNFSSASSERLKTRSSVQELPEPFRAELRERVPDADAAAQARHVRGRVVALDAFPALGRELGAVLPVR
jgi:hypothetical protein